MRRVLSLGLLAAFVSPPVEGQERAYDSPLEARVWLDRGDDPVLQRGDRVRVYYRTSVDAHTAIFRIDTDGRVTLVQPAHPGAEELIRGGRDYRLLFPQSAQWVVAEDPGIGYYFIVASEQPLDFSRFEFVPDEDRWDLGRVGETVYEDPYVAIDAYVAELISDWEVAPYALDFIEYSVGEAHSYPRFLCYDCHGYRPYTSWNPYTYACTDFRVVLWDDPYYYAAYRYAGTRVVFPRPLRNRPRYTVAVRAPGEGWSPLVRTRQAPPLPRRVTQYKEPEVATTPRSATPARRPQTRAPSAAAQGAVPRRFTSVPGRAAVTPNSARRAAQPVTPSVVTPRRPSSSGSTPRTSTSRPGASTTRPSTARSATPRSATPSRPTLQRRPPSTTTRGGTFDRANTSRPNGSRPSTTRAPAGSGSRTRVVLPSRPRAQPRASQPRRAPVTRNAPVTRRSPSAWSRPTVSRSRPITTRARPAASGARPTMSRPSTRAAPARRPTIRTRPKPPPRRRGRGG